MKYRIETIPHAGQRYDTVGDWIRNDPGREGAESPKWVMIRVSALSDWRYEFLVMVHEMIEEALCREEGIHQNWVDYFDMNFNEEGEPGDHPRCPYRRAHKIASRIEKKLAEHLRVNWEEYEKEINALEWKRMAPDAEPPSSS